jgi:hypothetical protein
MRPQEKLYKSAWLVTAAGLLVEAEKMAGRPIREHLSQPLNWPFIYGSDLAPSTLTGIFAGFAGYGMANFLENRSPANFAVKTKRVAAVAMSTLVAAVPIGFGVTYEAVDKCDAEQRADYTPEVQSIHACHSDPVDASIVVIGGLFGIAGGVAGSELDREARRRNRLMRVNEY